MTNKIINYINFAENDDHYNYTRIELVELDNGKVFYLDVECDEYLDLDEDSFEERWELGIEVNPDLGSLESILDNGLKLGYFLEKDSHTRERKKLYYNRKRIFDIVMWLKVNEYVFR
jgi:hypothetical protein